MKQSKLTIYPIPENAIWKPCRGCDKDITFIKNEKGNLIPITREGTNHFIDCPEANTFRRPLK